jgi:Flp pilus assembly protein TadB
MPTPDDYSSKKPRVKTIAAPDPRREHETRRLQSRQRGIDWLALWSLSIALSALVMAAVVYDVDKVGASVILAGAAGVVALVLLFSETPNEHE